MSISALKMESYLRDFEAISCQHCGAVVPEGRNDGFCCSGCSAVFQLLKSANLDGYYRIRKETGDFRAATPVHPLSEKLNEAHPFLYLDEPSFRAELGIDLVAPKVQFYLEGIHCTACLWLIEKLPDLLPRDVYSSRLDLQNSVAEVQFRAEGSISNAAEYLDRLGYRPHPIFSNEQKSELQKKDARTYLSRMAVAGAMAGNIMLFAVAIYAGAEGFIKVNFDRLTLLLSLPVYFYSAIPLYQNSWSAIKNKRWSVDIPIVIAIVAGFVASTISILTDGDQNYLDSLTGLVFLLLGSRYYLMRLQKNAFEGMQFSESFYPVKILRNDRDYVWVKDLVIGDVVEVPPGLRIPVDGMVVKGRSHINESIISGESVPRLVVEHESVFAGSLNAESTIWVRVDSVAQNTRVGKIAKEIQNFEISKNETVKLADQVAKIFTLSVLAWSTLVILYFGLVKGMPVEGLQRVLALLIVSCPCAFAIATPLALVQAYQILLRRGMYLKDPNDIEKVSAIRRVAFDKTGTLTEGVLEVESVEWSSALTELSKLEALSLVRELERDSQHPVARALLRYSDLKLGHSVFSDLITSRTETPGVGVSGVWRSRRVEVGAAEADRQDLILSVLRMDGEVIALFRLTDRVRKDAKLVMDTLKSRGLELWVLSGDQSYPVHSVTEQLGILESRAISRLSPESKAEWLSSNSGSLYVGDGANDGLALKKATMGVAAHGALDISMKAADGYLTQNKLQGIADLFVVSEETRSILVRHLIFTIAYNGSTIALASMGLLKPLIAAILMPASSVIILLSTQFGTKNLRSLK